MSATLPALSYEKVKVAPRTSESARALLSLAPATPRDRRLAAIVVGLSSAIFLAALPFAKEQLAPVSAFIPAYQAALVVNDLITAVLLFGQFSILRSRALLLLASGYLFTACMAFVHALSFPGLFSPSGLLGAGPQSTAWLYMFWHAGFPLLAIAYALDKNPAVSMAPWRAIAAAVSAVLMAACALGALATSGQALLPAIMHGNRYTPAMILVVGTVWALSAAALTVLWRRRPHSVLDLWLMVVMGAWIFDIGLSAVFNAGRFDLGFYAGRIYGLLAASFVLVVLLLEHTALHARLARADARHAERLRILHEIDRAVAAEKSIEDIAGAVIEPLRGLLGVPRAIVNRFDLAAGQVEWIAAAGRRRVHVGPGVRYSIALMGDVQALARGETQLVDVPALAPGPDRDALLASDVRAYMVVPMLAGGELLGAISFGGPAARFPDEQVRIAREVATQLAIALRQARLLGSVRAHAAELEARVHERTAALDAANRELEDLYNRAPCGYHSVDAEGLIVRINDTWLAWLGYAREEVAGKMRHADLMTPESAERFWKEAFPQFRREGSLQGMEFEYRRKDGSTFIGSLNATSIYDARGRYVMSRSTIFDVTERRRAEHEARALARELESFSYSVSHDLRAPLRAVDGYARMLAEDYGEKLDAEGRRLLGVVRDSATRMGRLIDDLLAFSRLGRQEPARRRVHMDALVRDTIAEVRGDSKALIETSALPAADADPAMLKQVWINLIGNALKYSSKRTDARVEIGGREEGRERVYWVRDNGAGFDMRYAQKLFGVFQRLHRADEFPGTGVGLALVHRVVTRHGGRVWAEGKPGEGAIFHFSLP